MASPPSTVESTIRGNVSDDIKNDIHHVMTGLVFEPTFAWSVGSKLRITDVDRLDASQGALVNGGPLETTTARVICELDVDGCEFTISSGIAASSPSDGFGHSGLSNVRRRRNTSLRLHSVLDGLVSDKLLDSLCTIFDGSAHGRCTTLTYFLYDDWRTMHVSSTLNISYHDQATA